MTTSTPDYLGEAKKVFAKLKDLFIDPHTDNYWQIGHSFDTIIDYLIICPEDSQGFGDIALNAYNRSTYKACWYDDFGWWGIAALKASQLPNIFPDTKGGFKKKVESCWDTFNTNAPNVWNRNGDAPECKILKPRFGGGVWNADWSKPDGCGGAPSLPNLPPLCNTSGSDNLRGIQNTVTNGLYWVLASRLFQTSNDNSYRTAAETEYAFLKAWIEVGDPDQTLWNPVDGGAVVRERVATYATDDQGEYPTVCGYVPGLAWSGDQGLILGGFVDRMIIWKSNYPEYPILLQRAKDIVTGVKNQIATYHGGILSAWVTDTEGGDPEDYSTGVGVYMRYLLYAYLNNNDLQKYFVNSGQVEFVRENADHILGHSVEPDDLVTLTNNLAILVAAYKMTNE